MAMTITIDFRLGKAKFTWIALGYVRLFACRSLEILNGIRIYPDDFTLVSSYITATLHRHFLSSMTFIHKLAVLKAHMLIV